MKITVLPKTGIHESEKYAVQQIEKALPREWRGYASLEIMERGRLAREVDLVLLLPDRILLLELKRWRGQIKSDNGYWTRKLPGAKDFEPMDVSPVKKNKEKERILKSYIERSIKGGKAAFVDSRVILCGGSAPPILTDDEKPWVLQLEEFVRISDQKTYERLLPVPKEFSWRTAFKPLDYLNEFELLFKRSPDYIRAREFSWQNFKVEGEATFKHPDGLYQEFKSVNKGDPNYRALLRRWDFSQLGTSGPTQEDWINVAHREPRVYTSSTPACSRIQTSILACQTRSRSSGRRM